MLTQIRHIILAIIDFCHRPFARIIPTQTFRYLACGGSNTVLNIFIQFLTINFVLHKQSIHLLGLTVSPEVAAWIIAFTISFPPGFIMSRYIVFPESNLHGRIQLFRYALTTITFILISYTLVRVFAYYVPAHPTISYTIIQVINSILSYISQRTFTFKTVDEEVVPD